MVNFQKYRLKKCCFLFELSVGAKWLGAIGVLFNGYVLTTMSVSICRLADEAYNGSSTSKYILILAVTGTILFFIDFLSCILLIKASMGGQRKLIKPYLTISKLWIMLYGLTAFANLQTLLAFFIRIYCLFCIYSFYWSLPTKKDKSQLSDIEEAEEPAQFPETLEVQET